MTRQRTVLILGSQVERERARLALISDRGTKYNLLQAETGAEGLLLCQTEAVDGVILPINLPDIDGLWVLRQLKINHSYRCPAVIMLANRADIGTAVKAIKQGAEDYLVRDQLDTEQLRDAIQAAIDQAALRNADSTRTASALQQAHRELAHRATELELINSELTLTLEELQTAEEEVRVQNEEILVAQQAAEAERQRYQDLFNFAPDGYLVTDRHGAIQEANLAIAAMLQHQSSEPIRLVGYVEQDDRRSFRNFLRSLLKSPQTQSCELRLKSTTGTVFPAAITATAMHDGKDQPITVRWLIRDITERKRTEAILQENEEKMRMFVRYAPVGIAMFDRDMRYIRVSQRWVEDYNLGSIEAVLGRSHYDLFEVPDHWKDILNRCLAGAIEHHDQEQFIRADQSEQWVRWEIRPWHNATGAIDGIIIFAEDITDRKLAEAALRKSEERYRVLAEAIPQFVFVTNTDGQNEYVNQQFCQYTGLSMEQMLGLDWLDIIHPDDLEQTRDRWLESVEHGTFYEIEYRFRRFDGRYRWFLGQGTPEVDEGGEILRWFGTCTDIHEKKQLEAERIRLLEQEQAAREQAETANRLKDEFLAVLSHELRSPLNPILGWTKLLQNRRLDETQTANALTTIERNAQLQAQLIEDLLDISRIMRGKLTLKPTFVNLAAVISDAIDTVRLAADAKQIQLEAALQSETKQVFGDASRLQQVVWNLLSNAVKFTPSGGRVTVTLSAADNQAQIQVIDTGKGINPEFVPYVFEYFRQEDGSTTRKFGGLGLGLAIARQIVELHGGTIRADSLGEDQGATFTVTLPTTTIAKPHTAQPTPKTIPPESRPLSGLRILVVDDDPDSREFVGFVVRQAGAEVLAFASAIEALQTIQTTRFDVLLSDVGMPEMDGYALMREVGQLPVQIPAIALTAYAGELDQQQALNAGFRQHIAKPTDPTDLVQRITTLVQPSPQASA